MARLARIVLPGVPHHVTQRGNRREHVFFEDGDYALYLDLPAGGLGAGRGGDPTRTCKQSPHRDGSCRSNSFFHEVLRHPFAQVMCRREGRAASEVAVEHHFREKQIAAQSVRIG